MKVMKVIKAALLIAFVVLALPHASAGQDWNGIVLLQSKCEEVKQALGVRECKPPRTTYYLKDETVTIKFVACPCPTTSYGRGGTWNVPPGTVSGVTRQLHSPLPITDFDVTNGSWDKTTTDLIGQVIYNNEEVGISLSTVEGEVNTINYFPAVKNNHLRCPEGSLLQLPVKAGSPSALAVDAYGDIPFEKEKTRLDEFANKLKEIGPNSQGYIVVYTPCLERDGATNERARRAKRYLINTHGIESKGIGIINGGPYEVLLVELYAGPHGIPKPLIHR